MPEQDINVLKPGVELNPPSAQQPEADELTRNLFESASPSVVRVEGLQARIPIEVEARSARGSGFFMNDKGEVATNSHVALGNRELFVRTNDGKRYRARIDRIDDIHDLAILKIDGINPGEAKSLKLGNSSSLAGDDRVFALGHPLGLRPTYISPGTFRFPVNQATEHYNLLGEKGFMAMLDLRAANSTPSEYQDFTDYMKQDVLHGQVHIEHGNSGGPLVDSNGEVVGVSQSFRNNNNSMSYFVPVEQLKTLSGSSPSKFSFRYDYEPSPLAKDYVSSWSDSPALATLETGIAGLAGVAGYKTFSRFPKAGAAMLGLYGATSFVSDSESLMASTNGRDTAKFGLATLSDAAITIGSIASVLPRTRALGKVAIGLGIGGQVGSAFIPNRLVLTDVTRTDGSPRPPFRGDDQLHMRVFPR